MQEKLACLCPVMNNQTKIYPWASDEMLHDHTVRLKVFAVTKVLESFSGQNEHWHRNADAKLYLQPANLGVCTVCQEHWLYLFDETNSDFYWLRLEKQAADSVKNNPHWPNQTWPKGLRNWPEFYALNWHDFEGAGGQVSIPPIFLSKQ
jgi:hypothetical protein